MDRKKIQNASKLFVGKSLVRNKWHDTPNVVLSLTRKVGYSTLSRVHTRLRLIVESAVGVRGHDELVLRRPNHHVHDALSYTVVLAAGVDGGTEEGNIVVAWSAARPEQAFLVRITVKRVQYLSGWSLS